MAIGDLGIENLTEIPVDTASSVVLELGKIGRWLQAIGIIVILWIVFQIVNFIINRKRMKRLDLIQERMENIEKKIDKLSKKK